MLHEREVEKILDRLLPLVPFEGWTDRALSQAGAQIGFDSAEIARHFPRGAPDALDAWIAHTDRRMMEAAASQDLQSMRVRDRIALIIRLRLSLIAAQREAVRRALAVYMRPWNAQRQVSALYRTVDNIWTLAGDRSHDINWYSKRLLLAGVYSATLLFWLDDESEDFSETWAFLDRRIGNVMTLGAWLPFSSKPPARKKRRFS